MKKYGILAYPAKHSLSPAMHNAAFEALGVEAVYERFEIEDIADFMEARDFAGLSVSLPHKETMMEYLDEVSEAAEAIGAVNTVINRDGRLLGENTDYSGFLRAIGDVSGKEVVVIGAGGSARAVVYGLLQAGAKVWIMNRDAKKAMALAEEFGCEGSGLDAAFKGDILVHTTSIWNGGIPDELPDFCKPGYVGSFELVMDLAYNVGLEDKEMTPLLEVARDQSVNTVSGLNMLLYQAVEQFKLWTGKKAPEEVMTEAIGL